MNKYHETPGLHVVTSYAQVHKLEEIDALIEKFKINYPIAFGGEAWQAGYQAASLPKMWIVGVDGKVIFAGDRDYEDILKKELAKVKYPGLGRADFHESLDFAAEAFGEGNYGEAYELAEEVYDEPADDKAEEDAEYIMERVEDRLKELTVRAESAEIEKKYKLSLACWEEIATKYKGHEDAEEAPQRLKELQDSKEVQNEMKASKELFRRMQDLDLVYIDVDDSDEKQLRKFRKQCLASYEEFLENYKGTAAGDEAEELIELFKELLGESDSMEKKDSEKAPVETD